MSDPIDDPLAPRRAALNVLEAALSRRGGLDEALSSPAVLGLSARDRSFARALVMATLRHLGPIDRALSARLKREPPALALSLLRLGVAQAFWLDTPAFAAVDTTVTLAPKPLRGLINAVLRGLLRDGPPAPDPAHLAPDWLLSRWRQAFGEAEALTIAAAIAEEPATDLSVKSGIDLEPLAQLLEAQILPGGSLRTRRGGDITTWPGFAQGQWWVQDASAAIPARLLQAKLGETVLDLCSAPGGKTFQLAAAGAVVTALDRSENRLKRLRESLVRLDQSAETVVGDAANWQPGRIFDAVLLDAPCSATGTFRRHPDVLWNARPGDIARLAVSQGRLLDAAADHLKPGGLLVYSVCSLEPEEGEAQAMAMLSRRSDLVMEPITTGECGVPAASVTDQGCLRILPPHLAGGLDGFFIARFRKA